MPQGRWWFIDCRAKQLAVIPIGAPMHKGIVNYLHREAAPSLFSNGKVLTRRDKDGSDARMVGFHREALQVNVKP